MVRIATLKHIDEHAASVFPQVLSTFQQVCTLEESLTERIKASKRYEEFEEINERIIRLVKTRYSIENRLKNIGLSDESKRDLDFRLKYIENKLPMLKSFHLGDELNPLRDKLFEIRWGEHGLYAYSLVNGLERLDSFLKYEGTQHERETFAINNHLGLNYYTMEPHNVYKFEWFIESIKASIVKYEPEDAMDGRFRLVAEFRGVSVFEYFEMRDEKEKNAIEAYLFNRRGNQIFILPTQSVLSEQEIKRNAVKVLVMP